MARMRRLELAAFICGTRTSDPAAPTMFLVDEIAIVSERPGLGRPHSIERHETEFSHIYSPSIVTAGFSLKKVDGFFRLGRHAKLALLQALLSEVEERLRSYDADSRIRRAGFDTRADGNRD